MTQKEVTKELHDRVRQCFSRHQFETFGEAMGWMQKTPFEEVELEAAEQGRSKFSTDILWMTALFGPKEKVDHSVIDVRKLPALTSIKIIDDDDDDEVVTMEPPQVPRRKKPRRRRF